MKKCQNCGKYFNENECKKTTREGKVVLICPKCKHGNY